MPQFKTNQKHRRTPTGLLAVVLMPMIVPIIAQMIVPIMANAQTNLNARLVLRPLTTGDITVYKLASTVETSGGMTTVAIGTPAYLEAQVAIGVNAADLSGVVWTITSKPAGSKASITDSVVTNTPVYEPSDRLVYQIAGRAMLRPDVTGPYAVSATITTHSGPTATVAQTIVGATYVGVTACARCHAGNTGAPAEVSTWKNTLHAQIFTQGITGALGSYSANCLACHTVGYDANSTVPNGSFSSLATIMNWNFPATLTQANWDTMPPALQNVGNIQCENCHGPGSEHANSGGTPWAISMPQDSGACNKCHDAPTHHFKGTEWYSSMHAVTTTTPSGAGREGCVGCHTKNGFIGRISGSTTVDTTFGAINCQTCHEPHGQTQPSNDNHLIRAMVPVKLADGTVVSDAGEGALCMNCHQARQNASVYAASTAGSSTFGPHHGPQADMLEGTNGFTYGQKMPTSAHAFVAKDTCVACHMQTVAATDPVFLQAGGHTFKMSATPAGTKTPEQLLAVCQGCHGPEITTFDFPLFDYNGDGVIEGVQTEVQHLMDQLSSMLPPYGQPKTSLSIDSTWTRAELEASYNWQFVANDGSRGVHNTSYAVALLKASIADLSKK
jgi:hypothetical protein